MQNKEDQGYRNPAYIYDEGSGGGGPDSRSGSSTSSKSSMKIISTKLKGQGRRRWLTLALLIFIAVVVIIAVTTAIYFTRNSNKGSHSGQSVEINQNGNTETTRVIQTTKYETTATKSTVTMATSRLTTTLSPTTTTTTTATTRATTTTQITSETLPTTTTTTVTTTVNSTTNMTSSAVTPPTTRATTSDSSKTTQNINTTTTTTTAETTNHNLGNLSVTMSRILYHPEEVKSVILRCQGRHQGDWKTLTIRRQFKDGYEPVAVAVFNEENQVEVFKFYPNVSHLINIGEFDVTLTLTFDPFLCAELTNFTCAMKNLEETATTRANISIYMPEPVIQLPHVIVEDQKLILRCVTEVWGFSGNIVWRFKPEYNTNFMNFSVEPINNITRKNCSTVLESTLTFNPTMFENGADFRCEIRDQSFHPEVIQTISSDVKLNVVPSNYCEGKRQFSVHPHPHETCTLVVYCLDTGPLVYEIECEPGHCYDHVKTTCLPTDAT